MVVLAPWSSLILPSGRTKPLVRGEENPAAWLPHRGAYQESGLLAMTFALRLDPAGPCGDVGGSSPGRSVERPRGNIHADSIRTGYSFAWHFLAG